MSSVFSVEGFYTLMEFHAPFSSFRTSLKHLKEIENFKEYVGKQHCHFSVDMTICQGQRVISTLVS